ncbi:MAG: hypothetical protein QNJ14_16470 [Woeseiaceae bacterium]|nr:hypothetical protein [Woeseiaceae bacterium]
MNRLRVLAAIVLVMMVAPQPGFAQSQDDALRGEFEAMIGGLNDNSFKLFHEMVDQRAMLSRVIGAYAISPDIRDQLDANPREWIESAFRSSFPPSDGEIIGTVVAFEVYEGTARALVRWESSGYRFSYHIYELELRGGDKLSIVDWIDFYQAGRFSELVAQSFVYTMPTSEATVQLLDDKSRSQGELFQVGEMFKAVRDTRHDRFFSIYDAMDESLRSEKIVTKLNLDMTMSWNDAARTGRAYLAVVETFPQDPLYSLKLTGFYIATRQFEKVIPELEVLQQGLGVTDGASESLKVSAAMALGDFERAEALALNATKVEPGLELSWWSLLRARTAAQNWAGATEAMTELEERFGHLLIPQKLRRDRFLKALIDQQEYKDWRAARDGA